MNINQGVDMESAKWSLLVMRNKQYLLYLENESNIIVTLFDTGFACDGTLYTYVHNVMVYPLNILFYVVCCSFFSHIMSLK